MTTTADTLEVFLHGESVGVLKKGKKAGSATFKYHHDAPYSLSVSMPVREAPYDPVATRNWFTNLLPEGDRLEHLAKHFATPVADYVELLREVGHDCSGAVTFGNPSGSMLLTHDIFAHAVAELPAVAHGLHDDSLRSVVSGFQPKATASPYNDGWNLSGTVHPTTHIVKPEPDGWAGMADAEAWAMTVASAAADTSEVTLEDFNGRRTLIVTRFDRMPYDGEPYMIHQEDLCQAMGLHFDRKYTEPGGNLKTSPSLARAAALLSERANAPTRELDELARHLTVNVIIGNLDWHAKNIGLLHDTNGSLSLAPLYDVVPVKHFLPKEHRLALTVNGKFRLDRIFLRDLVLEAESWGMTAERAEHIIRTAVEDIAHAVPVAEEKYPLRPDGVLEVATTQLRRLGSTLEGRA